MEEIDWGKAPLHLLGPTVDSQSLNYGFFVWKPEFANGYMSLHIEHHMLVVENFTIFTDGSKRSNYRTIERFRRLR